MKMKVGKVGALVSLVLFVLILFGIFHFGSRLWFHYNLFPDLLLMFLLLILGYLSLKPSLLGYVELSFIKKGQLQVSRPFYLVKLFEDTYQHHTIVLKELAYVMIVKPERASAPDNFLFFMRANSAKATLVMYFDEKEAKPLVKKLSQAKIIIKRTHILDVDYDAYLGASTLF